MGNRSRRGSFLCLTFAFIALTACSTKLPPAGVRAYYQCDYKRASEIFRVGAEKGGKDLLLYTLALLSSAMGAEDYELAEKAALTSLQMMWGYDAKGRGITSLISAEAIKFFKGDPFEKSMAAIYAGIIFLNKGDFDNARAAFSKAVMATAQKDEKHRNDFGLANTLQAHSFLINNEKDNARIAMGRAKKRFPSNPYLSLEKFEKANAVFVIELGQAPQKFRKGPGASLADYQRRPYAERYAKVSINGRTIGESRDVGDLTYQAKTKGRSGKDAVQVTKGVARDAAIITTVIAADQAAKGNKKAGWVALGAGIFALANQSQADIRQWELLPDRIQILPARLKPGKNVIRVEFYDSSNLPLSMYDQVWYYDIEEGEKRIFLYRSHRCAGQRRRADVRS